VSQVVIRRIEGRFEPTRRRSLFSRAWVPHEVDRALVVVHGFGEHCGRYEETASWFARRGSAVHAYDQQGHGMTAGRRGHIDSFESVLDDLEAFIDQVRNQYPDDLPLVLVGHSWGGLVVTSFACEREPDIDLLVASAAALSLSPDLSRLKIAMAGVLKNLLPRFSMDAGLDVQGLSRDPDVVQRYVDDPLVHGRSSTTFAAESIEATRRTAASASSVLVPMLMLHGVDDPLCLCSGSRAFYEQLPHDEVPGSELRTYPGLLHEIFNEPEREEVYADLLAWIQKHE